MKTLRTSIVFILTFITLQCGTAFFSFAQSPTLPLITNFTTRDYHAHSQNLDLLQDKRGVMYFANVSGLLEFDGNNWQIITIGNAEIAYSIDMDDKGKIYVGGNGDFGCLNTNEKGQTVYESFLKQLPDSLRDFNVVWNTYAIGGKVYFNSLKYLFKYEDGSVDVINPHEQFHLSFVVNDELWILEKEYGLYSIVNDKPVFVPGSEFFNNKSIFAILPYNERKVLIATASSGLFLFSTDKGLTQPLKQFQCEIHEELINSNIYGGILLNSGQYAFNTTQDGIYIISKEGNLVQHISRGEGLQSETVLALYQDSYNQLWCALGNGISLISLNSPLSFAAEGRGFYGAIEAITKHGKSMYYLATTQGVFSFMLPDRWSSGLSPDTFDLHKSMDGGQAYSEIQGVDGQCFDIISIKGDVLMAADNIYRIQDMQVKQISDMQARVLHPVERYAYSVVIAGGRGGVGILKREDDSWKQTLHITDLPDEVISIAQDFEMQEIKGDSLCFWLGMRTKGTIKICFDMDFDGYQMQLYDSSNGLPEGGVVTFTLWNNSCFNVKSEVYRFDYRANYFYADSSAFSKIMSEKEISVTKIKQSPEGDIWITNGNSVYKLKKSGSGSYDVEDLAFLSVDLGAIYAIYPDSKGICWLGGDDGMARYDANVKKNYNIPYNCLIRSVAINEDSLLFEGMFMKDGVPAIQQTDAINHTFNYDFNAVSFGFSSTFYEYIDKITYSYKLDGFDKEYSAWKNEIKAVFTNLPEGNYVFRVKARNVYQTESTEATFEFVILPPWYRTWWAYSLYVLGVVLLFYGLLKFNARRLQKDKERLEAIVKARTKEIAEKNVTLELQNQQILKQKALVEEKNRNITDSILYAEKIQRALLTTEKTMSKILDDYFVLYRPKDILSGDFYWAHDIEKENKVIFACADCTGHGVPGALMSVIGHSFLNEIIIENRVGETDKILNILREQIINALGQKEDIAGPRDGMDIALCSWDKSTNTLDFSGANNPLYIIRDNELKEIEADRRPVGFSRKITPFTKKTMQLQKGDMLYTFSDGYADQFRGTTGKKFKYKRFRELLLSIHDEPMKKQKTILDKRLKEWMGNIEQVDDICIIGVRV